MKHESHPRDEEAQRAVREALSKLDRVATPPERAVQTLEQAIRTEATRRRRWRASAMVSVAIVAAACVVVIGHQRAADPFPGPFMDEIALDHLHYVKEPNPAQFSGSREALVTWFTPTLGHPMRLASLEATNYIGGRNCWLRGKYAALVLAERANHRLSLFDIPDVSPRRAACGTAQGVRICAIPDPDGGSRVLVGDLSDSELMRLLSESI